MATANDEQNIKNKLIQRLNGLSSAFNIDYAMSPRLRFEYPPINAITLENITNALISTPKFYVQTLHLMNKMNLPCPLVPYVRVPALSIYKQQYFASPHNTAINVSSANQSQQETQKEEIPAALSPVDMSTSESESELESDTEKIAKQMHSQESEREPLEMHKVKKLKLKAMLNEAEQQVRQRPTELTEVFEKPGGDDISSKFKSKTIKIDESVREATFLKLSEQRIESTGEQGFKKIYPLLSEASSLDEQMKFDSNASVAESSQYISKTELEKGRLKLSEMRELAIFKNYEKGETNTRLYLKNVAKKADESDLKRIYGRYINWNDSSHCNSFDIRLMKEGRMKGQAFITLPNERIATEALEETNGYLLYDKPIVVTFARSAKPK
jgi:U11/U12 small nuclear ribonucleoprotein 65 kDa protein